MDEYTHPHCDSLGKYFQPFFAPPIRATLLRSPRVDGGKDEVETMEKVPPSLIPSSTTSTPQTVQGPSLEGLPAARKEVCNSNLHYQHPSSRKLGILRATDKMYKKDHH
ncbi:hypothetical protein K0M31_019338 [Melipona bicolor]|uniref:Uncharacterized protein n=1 Tax=Melipona bicolor TaxID=60889 RepID=A0AA40G217_9HYME|nr:hypothetical protein K0M31_019338 [Melipona bicolor]